LSKGKKTSIEDLIQKFLNAKGQERKHLLAIIRRIRPDFKEPK